MELTGYGLLLIKDERRQKETLSQGIADHAQGVGGIMRMP